MTTLSMIEAVAEKLRSADVSVLSPKQPRIEESDCVHVMAETSTARSPSLMVKCFINAS